jgi:hypothetical protein
MTQEWYDTADQGSPYSGVHALFIDFRKALDLVDHEILLAKLGNIGINKQFWLWCKSFLMNRTQQVKFLNALSIVEAIPACVPQVLLSPLCYLTFISMTWKFAIQMNFQQ